MRRGRYAPSPTGVLHLGNLRTALLAWLFAHASGRGFTLRIEDLDRPRVRPGATSRMLADLRWLGLDWDEGPDAGGPLGPYFQSQREALYANAFARLRASGLVYPCYCARSELARIASAPQQDRQGESAPRYSGTCRGLTAAQRAERETAGRRPSWRFRAPDKPITFTDVLHGEIGENVATTVGDFIVRRSDGVFAYQLAVVVDDALMGVDQVVRGDDLLGSTARQLALYDALGYPRPTEYAHVPLALDAAGARLAKREAAAGLGALRAAGRTAEEIVGALAASCGLWPEETPATLAQVLTTFDPAKILRIPSVIAI
ncbi:MAG TPA: tRNA glutamyl-Q(34) synthetase GluQRS [Ktedonobacterales bacterium]|jgi:glutamyl-tRNA synthetase